MFNYQYSEISEDKMFLSNVIVTNICDSRKYLQYVCLGVDLNELYFFVFLYYCQTIIVRSYTFNVFATLFCSMQLWLTSLSIPVYT